MKHLLTLSLFLISIVAYGQWQLIHENTDWEYVQDVDFISVDTGFVIGNVFRTVAMPNEDDGFVARTTDGGISWNRDTTAYYYWLSAIHMLENSNYGYIAGQDGNVWRTSNKGYSWEWIGCACGWANDAKDIGFFNDSVGIVHSVHEEVWTTSNYGEDWQYRGYLQNQILDIHFLESHHSIEIIDDSIAFISSAGVWRTKNQGQSWSKRCWAVPGFYASSCMIDSSSGLAVGDKGMALSTTDGGNMWYPSGTLGDQDLRDIVFVNDTLGFIVGGGIDEWGWGIQYGYEYDTVGIVLTTTDGGLNWNRQVISNTRINAIEIVDNVAYAVGDSARVFKLDLNTISIQESLDISTADLTVHPNPASNEIRVEHSAILLYGTYIIYDLHGKAVLRKEMRNRSIQIDISRLEEGMYSLVLVDGVRVRGVSRFLKK
jgi:photosystem II stability/assembly factor-like uncharacterized protein